MRLINPVYVQPPGPLAAIKAEIDAWFAANSNVQSVTFDQFRNHFANNGFPGAVDWTDGQIHGQLIEWGYEVAE